jgi:hypothetical protein
LVSARSPAPAALAALDQALAVLADHVELDGEAYDCDATVRAEAIGICAGCGTDCWHDGGANERCAHPAGCGALNGNAPGASEALRTSMRKARAETARQKLRGLSQDQRCHDECPAWCVSEVDRGSGFAIQRCDDCWARRPEDATLEDYEAEALPEALISWAQLVLLDAL